MLRARIPTILAALLLASALPASAFHVCGIPVQPAHVYTLGTGAEVASAPIGAVGGATATVVDMDAVGCDGANGDGIPLDLTGDYETGIGGAYFATNEDLAHAVGCGRGSLHHYDENGTISVADAIFAVVHVAAGYEGLDPEDAPCGRDGVIGDDANDCLVLFVGSYPADPCPGDDASVVNADVGVWGFFLTVVTDSPSASTVTSGIAVIDSDVVASTLGGDPPVRHSQAVR